MGRDRRVARGALPVLRRGRRARRSRRRGRDAARGRRRSAGHVGAASRARTSRDPRPHCRPDRPAPGGDRTHDLRRGRQADQDRPRRGRARRLHLPRGSSRGPHARRRGRPDGRISGRRRQGRLHSAPADRRRRRDLAVQLPLQPRRPQGRPRAGVRLRRRAQAGERRRRSPLSFSPSWRRRPASLRAGSTSSSAARPRSATCWSRTSASACSASRARPRWAGSSASARRARRSCSSSGTRRR